MHSIRSGPPIHPTGVSYCPDPLAAAEQSVRVALLANDGSDLYFNGTTYKIYPATGEVLQQTTPPQRLPHLRRHRHPSTGEPLANAGFDPNS